MKLTEFEYKRPNIEEVKSKLETAVNNLKAVENFENQSVIIDEISEIVNYYESFATLASINYSKDTENEDFQKEDEFYNENSPVVFNLINDYYKQLIQSPYRDQLVEKYGEQFMNIVELTSKTRSEKIISDQQKENQLSSEYTKLLASAKIMFEGEERNLAGLVPFQNSPDREMRKKAMQASSQFFIENEEELDRIYDELVHLRNKMARDLGFNNYVEMGYAKMLRSDYNPEMVAKFRADILKYVVPVATKLRKLQADRLGLDELKFHDEALKFKSGNPTPKGDPNWIVDQATKMYQQLSPETNDFFNFMKENELMDLVNRKGKAGGGYCTYIPEIKSPFIFSNFNGTTHDIKVLTHEAGHAFQIFNSRNFELPEYYWPTYEACEIHSMSMEFLTWPWMELFFEEDIEKFKYEHIFNSITFLPYGVAVDEFQHWVYENPNVTPKERKDYWSELEKKYLPHRVYEDDPYMENGGRWQRQMHIYRTPFYYIDYTLAQICAFQFWIKSTDNMVDAWSDYLKLCKAGGSKSFLNLVELANLESPFKDGVMEKVMGEVESFLDTIDDSDF